MARRRKKPLPTEPVDVLIEAISHDGRGIAHIDGKTAFVEGALPGETVRARYHWRQRKFDELVTEAVLSVSPDRVEPPCRFASLCGGCNLQHMATAAQVQLKQQTLAEQFEHFGGVQPHTWLPALTDATDGYRRKARLGVRYVAKKGGVLVGFREKRSNFICEIDSCAVLHPRVAELIMPLRQMLATLQCHNSLPQIEVAMGDDDLALVFRHLEPMQADDLETLIGFCKTHGIEGYLQPKGPKTVHKVWPETGAERLYYRLPDFDLRMQFHPMDFTQVNSAINRAMVSQAMAWLEPAPGERILDLFCGLGNFTLALARHGAQVTGVEGVEAMVERGYENAKANGIDHAEFACANLHVDELNHTVLNRPYDKVLIDPPRSGALEVVSQIKRMNPARVLYVSCNPATLARDAGVLQQQGYRMTQAGIMDMFPHTAHVESMALFERCDKQA